MTSLESQDRRFATGLLQPETYTFAVTGTGNANLYVKAGSMPTSRTFDCKSVNAGSSEGCAISLQSAINRNVLVRGAAASQVTFIAKQN